jgi:hypothetical protein
MEFYIIKDFVHDLGVLNRIIEHLGSLGSTQDLEFVSASASIKSFAFSYSPNFPSAQ